jgi:hypothetical protein
MPLNEKNRLDYFANKHPKCPYCDLEIDIGQNELWELYQEDDSHVVECPFCECEFNVRSSATWSFSTDEQEDDSP